MLCPVCRKDFTHSASLKKHIIKNHEAEEVEQVGVDPSLVIGQPLQKQKSEALKTNLEEEKDQNQKYSCVKVDDVVWA